MHDAKSMQELGFMIHEGGVHAARTMMFRELEALLECVETDAPLSVYQSAVIEENLLVKGSGRSRQLTFRHLKDLYALDSANPIFAGLRYFWERDAGARPQLALLAASARDSLLREVAPDILSTPAGSVITRESVEAMIETRWPERFSTATRKSTAQNINGSLTVAGYLCGRSKKIRTSVKPATATVAFALYLAWLQGGRGELLLQSTYCQLLDIDTERLLSIAVQASSRGWMRMRRVDNVIDVEFPALADIVQDAMRLAENKTNAHGEG